METVRFIWQPVAKGTVFIHEHTASFIFLCRLKEKEQIVGRLSALELAPGGLGQTVAVHIVSAGMHPAFMAVPGKAQSCIPPQSANHQYLSASQSVLSGELPLIKTKKYLSAKFGFPQSLDLLSVHQ